MKQLNFITQSILLPNLRVKTNSCKEHGGSATLGKRRKRRPLSVKSPLHLVLRSDFATSSRSLLRHRPLVHNVIKKAKNKFKIRIYEMAIVSNHIHLLIKGRSRRDIQNFFRVVSGHIAQEILRKFPLSAVERGGAPAVNRHDREQPAKTREKDKFWQMRIYSRVVSWGREHLNVKKYVIQNALEALGIIAYKLRTKATTANAKQASIRINIRRSLNLGLENTS